MLFNPKCTVTLFKDYIIDGKDLSCYEGYHEVSLAAAPPTCYLSCWCNPKILLSLQEWVLDCYRAQNQQRALFPPKHMAFSLSLFAISRWWKRQMVNITSNIFILLSKAKQNTNSYEGDTADVKGKQQHPFYDGKQQFLWQMWSNSEWAENGQKRKHMFGFCSVARSGSSEVWTC